MRVQAVVCLVVSVFGNREIHIFSASEGRSDYPVAKGAVVVVGRVLENREKAQAPPPSATATLYSCTLESLQSSGGGDAHVRVHVMR